MSESMQISDLDDVKKTKMDEFLNSKESLEQKLSDFELLRNSFEGNEKVYCRPIASGLAGEVLVEEGQGEQRKKMLMFGANNYLGMANHPETVQAAIQGLQDYGLSMSGSAVLSGTSDKHVALSKRMSTFKGQEDTVLFSSGYAAQQAWMSALLDKEDIVFFDAYSHTSFSEGLKLVGCKAIPFKHNDMADLKNKLQRRRSTRQTAWIFMEGVYSMHGDMGNLGDIASLAKQYQCYLAVDDAHGAGVLGKTGRGVSEIFDVNPRDIDIYLGTFSKAFGAVGGFICCNHNMAEYIRCFGKPHMFSASLATPIVAGILKALEIINAEPERIARLHENVDYLIKQFKSIGIETTTDSAIIPVDVPETVNMRQMAIEFHEAGIFVNAVEYPAVPLNQQRFRITLSAIHSRQELDQLVQVFRKIFTRHGLL